jgi:putative ABC transport system substrate-binding protein
MGQQIRVLNVSTDSEIETAFATIIEARANALAVLGNPFLNSRRNQLVALAARHAIPAIYELREFVAAGGLMSYGPSITERIPARRPRNRLRRGPECGDRVSLGAGPI